MKNISVSNQKINNESKKIDISDLTEEQVAKFSFKLSQHHGGGYLLKPMKD